MPEERRISPAIIIPIGLGLGLAAVLGIVVLARAAPPEVYTCPICGDTFATEEELNYHIETAHPEVPRVAEFRISNLVITPSEVQVGQLVTISCTVDNIGTKRGDYTVTLGGDFMAQQVISLAPGESRVVSFEVMPDIAKTYSISVDGLSGTFRATTAPVADIRVENLVISPAEVYVGETVTISVQATNYGTATGTKSIVCTVS